MDLHRDKILLFQQYLDMRSRATRSKGRRVGLARILTECLLKVLVHLHKSSSLSGNFPVLSFQLRRRWTALSQAVSCTQDRGNGGSKGTVPCVQGQVSPDETGKCPQRKVGKGWRAGEGWRAQQSTISPGGPRELDV